MTLDKEKRAHGRKLFLIEGILSPFSIRTFMGDLMIAFALALGFNERQIGILTSGWFHTTLDGWMEGTHPSNHPFFQLNGYW